MRDTIRSATLIGYAELARSVRCSVERWRSILACSFILYALGRYGDAAALAREVTAVVPDSPLVNATLVAALVRDGKRDEARRLLAVHLQRDPSFSFSRIALEGPGERFMAAREDLFAALRDAGLP